MERSETVIGGSRMWLVRPTEGAEPTIIEVSKSGFVVGRDKSADLHIDDPKVSSRHAEILIAPGRPPELRDLGSTNGTFVNGVPIRKPLGFSGGDAPGTVKLSGNEMIRVGDTVLIASLIDPRLLREPPPK